MENAYTGTLFIIWLIYTIAAFVIYHKVFEVYYFNFGAGLLKELLICAIVGALLAGLTMRFATPIAIIIVVIGYFVSKKIDNPSSRTGIRVAIVIVAIVIFAVGRNFNKKQENKESEKIIETMSDEPVYDSFEEISEEDIMNELYGRWEAEIGEFYIYFSENQFQFADTIYEIQFIECESEGKYNSYIFEVYENSEYQGMIQVYIETDRKYMSYYVWDEENENWVQDIGYYKSDY